LGSAIAIEVNDRRALDAVWRDDGLWLTTTIPPSLASADFGQTTAHWFKLNTSAVTSSASPAGLITLDQQGNIGGEDIALETSTFFPSVAVNKDGNAKFGFSASAATIFAGAYATGHHKDDPPGTVQASETVKAGLDPYVRTFGGPRNRWGDYSGISVDPKDDKKFWVFNEFADLRGTPTGPGEDGRWGTAWAQCEIKKSKSGDPLYTRPITADEVVASVEKFSLANYPNPFNPTTTVTFKIPEASQVHMAVYDVLGRQVRLLVDGTLPEGNHTANFEAGDLPTGVYLLRMVTPHGIFTRTMQLVK